MFKLLYLIYGGIVVVVSTVLNLSYVGSSTGPSSSWSSHSGGTSSYGGGSTGSYSGGHHK
jgi:hypothetical protein